MNRAGNGRSRSGPGRTTTRCRRRSMPSSGDAPLDSRCATPTATPLAGKYLFIQRGSDFGCPVALKRLKSLRSAPEVLDSLRADLAEHRQLARRRAGRPLARALPHPPRRRRLGWHEQRRAPSAPLHVQLHHHQPRRRSTRSLWGPMNTRRHRATWIVDSNPPQVADAKIKRTSMCNRRIVEIKTVLCEPSRKLFPFAATKLLK